MTAGELDFTAGAAESGERVDAAAARRSGSARAAAQAAVRSGAVTVDGRPVRPSHRLRAGERVRGRVEDGPAAALMPEDIPVAIRYADEHVLVVSKPPGLVTHPSPGHAGGTLVNALLALGGPLAMRDPARPGIVHRLDRATSGLLLVARDDATLDFLQDELRARRLSRTYLALVAPPPAPASGTIDAPVGRHPARPRLQAVVPGGKPAVTHYRALGAAEPYALLEVRLESGRTHQVRVHLSHLGHPVAGDRAYGGGSAGSRLGLARPFLHAWRLAWPDPDTGMRREVTDDLAPDLVEPLDRAGLAGALPTEPE